MVIVGRWHSEILAQPLRELKVMLEGPLRALPEDEREAAVSSLLDTIERGLALSEPDTG